jgi:hypothetical protein
MYRYTSDFRYRFQWNNYNFTSNKGATSNLVSVVSVRYSGVICLCSYEPYFNTRVNFFSRTDTYLLMNVKGSPETSSLMPVRCTICCGPVTNVSSLFSGWLTLNSCLGDNRPILFSFFASDALEKLASRYFLSVLYNASCAVRAESLNKVRCFMQRPGTHSVLPDVTDASRS